MRTVQTLKQEILKGGKIKQKGKGRCTKTPIAYKELIDEKIHQEYEKSEQEISYEEFEHDYLLRLELLVYDYLENVSFSKPYSFKRNNELHLTKADMRIKNFTAEETEPLRIDIKTLHKKFLSNVSVDALNNLVLLLINNSKPSVELIREIINSKNDLKK